MRPVPSPQDALDRLVRLIHRHLTDDLRRSPWRGSADPLAGHCFVASEAIYYLLGGRAAGWKPLSMRHEDAPHWLLRHEPSGRVVDATEWQFREQPDAACAVGKGFMSSRPDTPSARARELMQRVQTDPDGPRLVVAAFAALASPPATRPNPGEISVAERASYDRIAEAVAGVDGRPDAELERAAGGLQLVGMGGHRVVFALDARRVLKVATDLGVLEPDERGQNTIEADRWRGASEAERALMAPVIARADDDAWIVMARTRPAGVMTNDQCRRFLTITDDVVRDNVGELDGRLVLHDYGRDARLPHRWNGRVRAPGAPLPAVVFHGTPHDFDELRPSDTGLFWFALDREVAERFSVHRSYVPSGNAAVWETRLAPSARVVDLANLGDPDVRALKENYSATAYAARYGAKLSDEDWVRHYATSATLEGERGVVQFLRARRIDGAVVDDNLKGEPFRSLAIWNRRAIGPSVRVALGQAEQDAARARVRPRDATRSNPPRGAKARKLPKGFVTLEMPAGTDLWRGSANPGDWSESWQWFTDDAFAARGYMEGRDHEWGIVSFDTKRPLTLVSLRTYEDLDKLAARLGVRDYDGDPRDVAHAVCEIARVDGWFIKEGDHDGADILLCAPDAIRPIAGVDQSDDWDWTPWPGY